MIAISCLPDTRKSSDHIPGVTFPLFPALGTEGVIADPVDVVVTYTNALI